MTKRGLPAIAIALIAVLGLCGAATAQAKPLNVKDARTLARALAQKQVRGRGVVSFHVFRAVRRSPDSIAFGYDDRTTSNVFCTAAIVVTRTVTTNRTGTRTVTRARFRGQKCKGIPADVLAVEAATRNAVRALGSTTVATANSLRALRSSVRRCRNLAVPRARREAVAAILDVALVEALEGPNDSALGDFVSALGAVQTTDGTLVAGIAGWNDYLAAIRSLPAIADPCATLQRWARAGWSADQSPIDLAAYRAINRRTSLDAEAIARTAGLLARAGVFPRTVARFTPQGLLLRLSPRLSITGGRGKLTLKPALL
jgi:hypothetical protein